MTRSELQEQAKKINDCFRRIAQSDSKGDLETILEHLLDTTMMKVMVTEDVNELLTSRNEARAYQYLMQQLQNPGQDVAVEEEHA